MQILKPVLKYAAVFLATAAVCLCLLLLCCFISKDSIKDNMCSSADYLCEREVFFYSTEGVNASRIDRYADSILLNIAYHYDSNDKLASVMKSAYYYERFQNENDNLRDAVNQNLPANKQYLRYWHGSSVFVRAAHLLTNIKGMYIINAVLLLLFNGALVFILVKNKFFAAAAGAVLSLLAAGIWYVPMSLEYSWVFLLAPVVAAIAIILVLKGKSEKLGALFLIAGVVTNFLDFLTSETVTLVFPLLLVVYVLGRVNKLSSREKIISAVKNSALWISGYAVMWVLKWGLAAIALKENVMPGITDHISERTLGNADGKEPSVIISLLRNIRCLFPAAFGGAGVFIAVVLLIGIAYVCYVYRRDDFDKKQVLIYIAAALVPYVRYIVLLNHSFLHYFFTYRAQAATILALCLIVEEMTGVWRKKDETETPKEA